MFGGFAFESNFVALRNSKTNFEYFSATIQLHDVYNCILTGQYLKLVLPSYVVFVNLLYNV